MVMVALAGGFLGEEGKGTAYLREILWQRSLTEEIGRISGYGGRTNSPVIFEDLVIMSSLTSGWGPHGRGLHRFWAMDKHTGIIRWWSEPSGQPLD